ncbi:DgyrCDS2625 [Dimorphilus gyrociliatus]|uniref:DgyrCDS2625 n=1 Tax=Dimorphilus gyrociliatus TaxID=2664684 RepID=A0A7I8VDM9_9ANNE|nr:DgyrCDS2625 [Dimorphilus gyrociliatus]
MLRTISSRIVQIKYAVICSLLIYFTFSIAIVFTEWINLTIYTQNGSMSRNISIPEERAFDDLAFHFGNLTLITILYPSLLFFFKRNIVYIALSILTMLITFFVWVFAVEIYIDCINRLRYYNKSYRIVWFWGFGFYVAIFLFLFDVVFMVFLPTYRFLLSTNNMHQFAFTTCFERRPNDEESLIDTVDQDNCEQPLLYLKVFGFEADFSSVNNNFERRPILYQIYKSKRKKIDHFASIKINLNKRNLNLLLKENNQQAKHLKLSSFKGLHSNSAKIKVNLSKKLLQNLTSTKVENDNDWILRQLAMLNKLGIHLLVPLKLKGYKNNKSIIDCLKERDNFDDIFSKYCRFFVESLIIHENGLLLANELAQELQAEHKHEILQLVTKKIFSDWPPPLSYLCWTKTREYIKAFNGEIQILDLNNTVLETLLKNYHEKSLLQSSPLRLSYSRIWEMSALHYGIFENIE